MDIFNEPKYDIQGNILNVGDPVAYINGNYIRTGFITNIQPDRRYIDVDSCYYSLRPDDLLKLR